MVPVLRNVVVLGAMASLVRVLAGYASRTGRLQSLLGQAAVLGASAVNALLCLGAMWVLSYSVDTGSILK